MRCAMLAKSRQLTRAQRAAFFTILAGTARALGEDAEAYRRRILREELGVDHLAEVSRTSGYDRLMCRLYVDRGDYAGASDYLGGSVRRWKHLIVTAARRITGRPDPYGYVHGVMVQSGMLPDRAADLPPGRLARDGAWMDFTDAQLRTLLAILNAHARRLQA